MAVSIDTVYQRVLVLANKEQRGYITPQEFNLLANQAQMEIFEQYFYDRNQSARLPGNNTEFSDVDTILEEKTSVFKVEDLISDGELPDDIYRLGYVSVPTSITNLQGPLAEEVTIKQFRTIQNSPLLKQTDERPVFIRTNFPTAGTIVVWGTNTGLVANSLSAGNFSILIDYVRAPAKVEWAYVVVNDKPLYNDNISKSFELHPSEETELVFKILKLAGVNLKAQEVVQVGQTLEQTQIQQEKQ